MSTVLYLLSAFFYLSLLRQNAGNSIAHATQRHSKSIQFNSNLNVNTVKFIRYKCNRFTGEITRSGACWLLAWNCTWIVVTSALESPLFHVERSKTFNWYPSICCSKSPETLNLIFHTFGENWKSIFHVPSINDFIRGAKVYVFDFVKHQICSMFMFDAQPVGMRYCGMLLSQSPMFHVFFFLSES